MKKTLMQEIEAVVGEVQDLLRKSGMTLEKDDTQEEMTPPADDAAAPALEAPAPDAIADQAAPAEGEAGLEGEAEHSDADLAAEAKGLSDEDLDKLLEVLMAEKEGRKAPEASMEGAEAPAPEMPAPAPAEKSMKEDYAKLGKSLETLAGSIEALNKKVDAISTPKAPTKVSVKAPAANAQDVQPLHKSQPAMKRLSKSETIEFMENELKKGNRLVDRNSMLDVVSTKSDSELHQVQDTLTKRGLAFPKL